jgi:hypothetical protein
LDLRNEKGRPGMADYWVDVDTGGAIQMT